MPAGFFNKIQLKQAKPPVGRVPQCGACGLLTSCRSPKMPVRGKGKRKILVVGEAPGKEEDRDNHPFVGPTGRDLQDTFELCGSSLFEDCWVTNALICRPPNNEIKDERRIDYCRPNLINTIKELEPEIIVLVGAVPTKSLLGLLWKDESQGLGIGRWHGFQIPSQRFNAWICPTYHPSFILREEEEAKFRGGGNPARLFQRREIRKALKLTGRPWEKVPDYIKQVELLYDPEEVAVRIENFTSGIAAFDFENSPLKPDVADSQIVSCSICYNGKETIAFPWTPDLKGVMRSFLRNADVGKVAQNLQHEERWCRRHLGTRVRGWAWDTMQTAHVLDCRPKITGLKFQAFARLGQEDYDSHIEPYKKGKKDRGGNTHNRMKELDLHSLLIYNGMDSLLEYHVAQHQAREMGVTL